MNNSSNEYVKLLSGCYFTITGELEDIKNGLNSVSRVSCFVFWLPKGELQLVISLDPNWCTSMITFSGFIKLLFKLAKNVEQKKTEKKHLLKTVKNIFYHYFCICHFLTHLRAISQEILKISLIETSLKITNLRIRPYPLGASEVKMKHPVRYLTSCLI